jgi:hypothetical protein
MLFLHRLNYHVFDRNYVEDDIVSQYLLFHRLHGAGGKEFAIEPILVVKPMLIESLTMPFFSKI